MFGFKKKKKPAPTKEKKTATKANASSKKVVRAKAKTSLRPIKEAKTSDKKAAKEVVEDYKKPEFVRKEVKLQSKKILSAEGWKRLLKGND
jgi:hypothetical protein